MIRTLIDAVLAARRPLGCHGMHLVRQQEGLRVEYSVFVQMQPVSNLLPLVSSILTHSAPIERGARQSHVPKNLTIWPNVT